MCMNKPEHTLGDVLRQAREDCGLTLEDVAYHARRTLPIPFRFSRAKLQRIEAEGVEGKVDPYLVQFLAALYKRPLNELSPAAAEQLAVYFTVVEQGIDASGWTHGYSDNRTHVAA